jgi:L,D-peptidoglycan transpeptidase YkuD (ErfK/YbiS/YcfS/YnhG family)
MGRTAGRRLGAIALAASVVVSVLVSGCTSSGAPEPAATNAASPSSSPVTSASSSETAPSSTAEKTTRPRPVPTPSSSRPRPPARTPTPTSSAPRRLPLGYSTGDAHQVITVTAASTSSTSGTLQAWRRVSGGWRRSGPSVFAYLGTDGMSAQPSETRSATPIGSFTLTRAFGRFGDPGTALPYTHTTPDDWWISEPGPLYNTRQRCASGCAFTRGDPNEHLYYTTPYYRYAVVIDYNTRNAPGGVRQGAGSAFFLHVSVGQPTAGCVAIPQSNLVTILRWLTPEAHPRILIGVD